MLNAKDAEEHRGQQHNPHVSPAVEGVKQAHGLLLMLGGACLQNGADQHLDQSAAHGINAHRNQDACKGVGQHFRQDGQQHQPQGGHGVGD